MWNEAQDFWTWVSVESENALIRPNQVPRVGSALDAYELGDLVTILYFGTDKQALNALDCLKRKYQNMMMEQEMNNHAAHSWN